MKLLVYAIVFWHSFTSGALSSYLTPAGDLSGQGVELTWHEVRSKSLKIVVEYQDNDGAWNQADLGSGFLISPDGLFVTAYHVMKYCLGKQRERSRFAATVDCSVENPRLRYKARIGDREYEIQVLSHLNEKDSTNGKEVHTPDEIIKQRDFVIAKLKADPNVRFPYWRMRDFKKESVNLVYPDADFELQPLMPPKRVFIAGFPKNGDLTLTQGFLNLTEKNRRGYFAANLNLYNDGYLKRHGIPPDTRWGIRVENHMSGGPVFDAGGYLVGVVVNGDANTAAVLSIENVLETFFSRSGRPGSRHAVRLTPTNTPLYLKENIRRN